MGLEFFEALRDLVSVVVLANAVTGHKDASMTEEHAEFLRTFMSSGNKNR